MPKFSRIAELVGEWMAECSRRAVRAVVVRGGCQMGHTKALLMVFQLLKLNA